MGITTRGEEFYCRGCLEGPWYRRPDGQQGHIDIVEFGKEFHIAEEARITGMVDNGTRGQMQDKANGAALAGRMEGLGHGHSNTGHLHRTAGIHAQEFFSRDALDLQHPQQFRLAHGPGLRTLEEPYGVAQVIEVIMGDQDQVGLLQFFSLEG